MINLEIRSTNVPDLTLIDLPGIARVATGNQSQDIEEQVRENKLITVRLKVQYHHLKMKTFIHCTNTYLYKHI